MARGFLSNAGGGKAIQNWLRPGGEVFDKETRKAGMKAGNSCIPAFLIKLATEFQGEACSSTRPLWLVWRNQPKALVDFWNTAPLKVTARVPLVG